MKFSKTVVALAIGLTCAIPVLAQPSTGSSSAATPGPSTQTAQAAAGAPDAQRMGAGPSTVDSRPADTDNHRDYSWLGLLGLAGLIGMRRRQDDNTTHRDPGTARTR